MAAEALVDQAGCRRIAAARWRGWQFGCEGAYRPWLAVEADFVDELAGRLALGSDLDERQAVRIEGATLGR